MSKIVFFGDSVTAGLQVGLTSRWAQRIALFCGYVATDIINAGIPGDTTDDMLARIQADVLDKDPSVCVLMLTVNDKTNNFTLAKHETNVRSIIGQLKSAGIKVVVISPPVYRSGLASWVSWVEKGEQVAGQLNCPFIDVWRDYANYYLANQTFNDWYVDYIHQTLTGNDRIFQILSRPLHSGHFVVGSSASEPVQSGCSERTLALADLIENGATVERLSRVINSIA
ncbi:Lysophospholipase L1 [Pseudomonas sp. NFACC09-4]|uniref:SGNH/GDSL hydrolase family protein n=1 Tax=Pseudomonas sp. NFACC09-4 TaxID=1566237 RepID=UPI000908D1CA|nr:GDSL-type esterase/lipase family protein [Pseudomonas sp. NFACC09-4]SFW54341.1 Lysophospholipase L1 [Pseudomonas sp. NFACC09-4]